MSSDTILIVDDDCAAREVLARSLRRAGWRVCTAVRRAEARAGAAAERPRHAIVEQFLSDGSGLDLLVDLARVAPGLNAVVTTRAPSIAAAIHAIRMGFLDYLPKPVDLARLTLLLGRGSFETDPSKSNPVKPWSLDRAEWEYVQATLLACGGNVSEAARRLRIPRRSLQRKLSRTPPL
jgi:two-component system, response regulator RegA